MTPSPVCSRPRPHPAAQHHPEAQVVNPDASRSFVVRDGGQIALHASAARESSPDSVGRPPAGHRTVPLVHRCRRSKSDHGRSGCRSAPEPGNERIKTAAAARSPTAVVPDVDVTGNEWNNAPAYVPQHGVGARRRYETWQLRSAPCLSQSTQQVVTTTVCARHAEIARTTRDGLWICGQRKRVAHKPTGQKQQQQVSIR